MISIWIILFIYVQHALLTKVRVGRFIQRDHFLDYSIGKYGHQLINDTKMLLSIGVLFLPVPLFWSLFDQQGSRWTAQALQMNGNVGFMEIDADQIQFLNPFLILLLIPIFNYAIYPLLSKCGLDHALLKLTMGGFLAAFSFFIAAIVQWQVENTPDKTVHMLWQVPQYIVLTMGEVMFSVTGLSFCYDQAPQSMKSVVQAIWLLTVAIGNAIVAVIAESDIFDSFVYEFILFGGLMILDMLIFISLAYRYHKNTKHITNEQKVNWLYRMIKIKYKLIELSNFVCSRKRFEFLFMEIDRFFYVQLKSKK